MRFVKRGHSSRSSQMARSGAMRRPSVQIAKVWSIPSRRTLPPDSLLPKLFGELLDHEDVRRDVGLRAREEGVPEATDLGRELEHEGALLLRVRY